MTTFKQRSTKVCVWKIPQSCVPIRQIVKTVSWEQVGMQMCQIVSVTEKIESCTCCSCLAPYGWPSFSTTSGKHNYFQIFINSFCNCCRSVYSNLVSCTEPFQTIPYQSQTRSSGRLCTSSCSHFDVLDGFLLLRGSQRLAVESKWT